MIILTLDALPEKYPSFENLQMGKSSLPGAGGLLLTILEQI